MNRCLTLGLLLVCLTCVLAQSPGRRKPPPVKVPELDERCLNCICQASSNCDETLKCHNGAGGSYFCGAYVISWAYWHDGGRPGDKGRAHDFETCLTNRTCAEEAVKGYMHKYAQDCDGSRAIDCYDFARIHKLGYGDCGNKAIDKSEYWQKFEICYAGYDTSYNNYDGANDGNYGGANDGSYGGANDGNYAGANGGNYGAGNDGSYDGANNGGVNYNGDNLGVFVDYGDDHIQARDARMGG